VAVVEGKHQSSERRLRDKIMEFIIMIKNLQDEECPVCASLEFLDIHGLKAAKGNLFWLGQEGNGKG
jgi:hypothetical protein